MTYKTNTNQNADIAEQIFKTYVLQKGWIVLDPSSRDSDYDFVIDMNGRFERAQVKKMTDHVLPRIVERSNQRTTENGKVRNSVDYAERGIEWLVGVDIDSGEVYPYHISNYSKDKPKQFKVTAYNGKKHPISAFPTNNGVRKNNE